jgi:hypothetical protein
MKNRLPLGFHGLNSAVHGWLSTIAVFSLTTVMIGCITVQTTTRKEWKVLRTHTHVSPPQHAGYQANVVARWELPAEKAAALKSSTYLVQMEVVQRKECIATTKEVVQHTEHIERTANGATLAGYYVAGIVGGLLAGGLLAAAPGLSDEPGYDEETDEETLSPKEYAIMGGILSLGAGVGFLGSAILASFQSVDGIGKQFTKDRVVSSQRRPCGTERGSKLAVYARLCSTAAKCSGPDHALGYTDKHGRLKLNVMKAVYSNFFAGTQPKRTLTLLTKNDQVLGNANIAPVSAAMARHVWTTIQAKTSEKRCREYLRDFPWAAAAEPARACLLKYLAVPGAVAWAKAKKDKSVSGYFDFIRVFGLLPQATQARRQVLKIHVSKNRFQEAREQLAIFAKKDPAIAKDKAAWINRIDKTERAVEKKRQAKVKALVKKAGKLILKNRFEQALKLADQIEKLDPKSDHANNVRIHARHRQRALLREKEGKALKRRIAKLRGQVYKFEATCKQQYKVNLAAQKKRTAAYARGRLKLAKKWEAAVGKSGLIACKAWRNGDTVYRSYQGEGNRAAAQGVRRALATCYTRWAHLCNR